MAKNQNESETLRQRRLANKEFLELKRMQRGEIDPTPADAATAEPQTLSKKASDFWFYYGKFVIAGVLALIAFSFAVAQCVNKPKYDITVIYFTYEAVPDSVTEIIADNIEKYCPDTDGNGEVNVLIANCSTAKDNYTSAMITKMQALIAAEEQAMLFITDDDSVKYFDNIRSDDTSFFEEDALPLPESLLADSGYTPTKQLTISVRNMKGAALNNEKGRMYYNTAKKIIDNLNK